MSFPTNVLSSAAHLRKQAGAAIGAVIMAVALIAVSIAMLAQMGEVTDTVDDNQLLAEGTRVVMSAATLAQAAGDYDRAGAAAAAVSTFFRLDDQPDIGVSAVDNTDDEIDFTIAFSSQEACIRAEETIEELPRVDAGSSCTAGTLTVQMRD